MTDRNIKHDLGEPDIPVNTLHPAFAGFVDMIQLVHLIKREVRHPRPSLLLNYNSLLEIRDLIAAFENDSLCKTNSQSESVPAVGS